MGGQENDVAVVRSPGDWIGWREVRSSRDWVGWREVRGSHFLRKFLSLISCRAVPSLTLGTGLERFECAPTPKDKTAEVLLKAWPLAINYYYWGEGWLVLLLAP